MKSRHWDRIGNGGLDFTELGFGTAPLGNLYQAVDDSAADAALEAAWESGCRYFDTAPLYGFGLAETRLNRFLRTKKRSDYIISTKIGRLMRACEPSKRDGIGKFFKTPSRQEVFDYSYDGVMRSIEFSMERLGVDRIDILYAHDLDIFTHGSKADAMVHVDAFMAGGYYALLSLRDQGVIKAFGAGVNEWEFCQILAERGDFDLFLLAGRYTLLEQLALDTFLPLCKKRGIGVVIGGPYNSGILATGAVEGAWFNYDPAPKAVLNKVKKIEKVCQAFNVPLRSVALRFPLLNKNVVSVIPGGKSVSEVNDNRESLDLKIPAGLWKELRAKGLMDPRAPIR